MLRHHESAMTFGGRSVPVFGFPQHGMRSHNSNLEVEQLGERIAEVVCR